MKKPKRSELEQIQYEAVREVIQRRVDWLKDDLNRVLDQAKEREQTPRNTRGWGRLRTC